MSTLNEAYESIKAACLRQREKGVEIRRGLWGADRRYVEYGLYESTYSFHTNGFTPPCGCAMSCYLVDSNVRFLPASPHNPKYGERVLAAASALGVDPDLVAAFISGFDRKFPRRDHPHMEWFDAGARLATELGLS